MSDLSLQQEAERAWHGKACVYIYAERGDSLETAFIGGYLAAAESRDELIKKLSRYATHEFGCPAIGAAGACDCGVEELWDHG